MGFGMFWSSVSIIAIVLFVSTFRIGDVIMSESLVLYMDQTGSTADDLVRPAQPVYIHASTVIRHDDAQAVCTECFKSTQAPGRKYGKLAKHRSGQRRIVDFVSAIATP